MRIITRIVTRDFIFIIASIDVGFNQRGSVKLTRIIVGRRVKKKIKLVM